MTAATVRPVAIKIDEDIKARVKRLAEARHRTAHWLMREAITQYVDREENRESFRQDTLKAWETTEPLDTMQAPKRPMLGWLSSSWAMTSSHLNATSNLVSSGAARCAAPL